VKVPFFVLLLKLKAAPPMADVEPLLVAVTVYPVKVYPLRLRSDIFSASL
jgi:hypothetical protein